MSLSIKVRQNGYIPKSGLLVVEQLKKLNIYGRAIDIGTGESGIIAHSLMALGASEVFASDVDEEILAQVKNSSSVSHRIQWHHCSLFPKDVNGQFDFIVSNPPQMPMSYSGHPHDYSGFDGRTLIEKFLGQAEKNLAPKGAIILLCFDFLGIEQRTNDKPSIIELGNSVGLQTTVLSRHKRTIRKNGKTAENIGWINKIYPDYAFLCNDAGEYFHEVILLKLQH
jgi:methylase of polypeptide subunit release factors